MNYIRPEHLPVVEFPVRELPPMNETQRVLKAALDLLGPNGEHWQKGGYCNVAHDAFCAYGAVSVALYGSARRQNGAYPKRTEDWLRQRGNPLDRAAFEISNGRVGHGADLNDRASSFYAVRTMFELAISLAATPGVG